MQENLQILIKNRLRLHARPAGKLVQEAQKYEADLRIKYREKEADAKSILDILMLGAETGSELEIRANGKDASRALDSISRIFQMQM